VTKKKQSVSYFSYMHQCISHYRFCTCFSINLPPSDAYFTQNITEFNVINLCLKLKMK